MRTTRPDTSQRRRSRILAAVAVLAVLGGTCTGCGRPLPPRAPAPVVTPETAAAAPTDGRMIRLPWPAPQDPALRAEAAGLPLLSAEGPGGFHVQLAVRIDGAPVAVPAGLGVNEGRDGALPAHGAPGLAAVHTHAADGTVHVTAENGERVTLGQLFMLWDVYLGRGQVGGYGGAAGAADDHVVTVRVDGLPVATDPAGVVLRPGQRITVEVTSRARR